MQPDRFPEKNKTLQPPQGMADCEPLDVWTDGKRCVSRWKMTWRERISALVFGRVWVHIWSGYTQPPIAAQALRTVFAEPSIRQRTSAWWTLHLNRLAKRQTIAAAEVDPTRR